MSYAQKLSKAESPIDWQRDAIDIDRQIRAFNPWPTAETRLDGEPVKLLRSRIAQAAALRGAAAPGTLLGLKDDALEVACGTGVLQVLELQRAGRKAVVARDFYNAVRPQPRRAGGVHSEHAADAPEFAPGATVLAAAARCAATPWCAMAAAPLRCACSALRDRCRTSAARVRAMHSGTLRWYLRLAPLVDALLKAWPAHGAAGAQPCSTVALHQIEYSRAARERGEHRGRCGARCWARRRCRASPTRCCGATCASATRWSRASITASPRAWRIRAGCCGASARGLAG